MSQHKEFDNPLFLAPTSPDAEAEIEHVAAVAEVTAPHDYSSIFSARGA
ncbi:hypothetical protein SAMN02745947_02171 [Rhodococcus rhodochrous J3]|uniref:Uncharacterized protein n=2 Tax=Rhodococcus rhodochrous TaxID=1829 RepID=A0AA46WXH0_RHORH|nr:MULTISPECIES: hypothetical protein [Rhodococcus]MBF4481517.1 hypothetical protein [Rhodococcus rhodochrous]MCB8912842.1 hypothetical protein [Rhodococcus rhodochrous]MCD2096509.1 hypothetical protein [Rhodococcus rhodochrous]MCD2121273.1 hypothetical protein [Rhodococcus rhodochrous]MCQ4136914.1 hypothetical protein [Rhodococcus rhodochrous]